MPHALPPKTARRWTALTLGHITREYPNKPDHMLAGPEAVQLDPATRRRTAAASPQRDGQFVQV
jgi:hypothetical protein